MPKLPDASNCVDHILKTSDNTFTKSEAKDLLKDANRFLKDQQKRGIVDNDQKALNDYLVGKAKEIQIQKKIDSIQTLRNFESKAGWNSYRAAYKDDPVKGLLSFMTGRFLNKDGSKLSVDAKVLYYKNKTLQQVQGALERANLRKFTFNPDNQHDITRALWNPNDKRVSAECMYKKTEFKLTIRSKQNLFFVVERVSFYLLTKR